MLERRPAPTTPYVRHDRVLHLQPRVLELLAPLGQDHNAQRLEWCALLYGDRDPDSKTEVVTTVIVPKQINHWGFYDVPGEAMAEASHAAGDHVLVAQLHAHPRDDVEHSTKDDDMAASRRIVSLVAPYYGAKLPSPAGIGVHDYQQDYWYLLTPADASRRVLITPAAPAPTFTDLR